MRIARSPLVPDDLLPRVRSISPALSLVVLVASLLAIFLLDLLTNKAPVQHLYYAPIVFSTLRFSRRTALLFTTAAVLLYHLASPRLVGFGHGEADFIQIAVFYGCCLCSAKFASDALRLRQMSVTDDLTGLSNLRGFEADLSAMVTLAQEQGGSVSLLVVDLDRLKSINDRFGHLAGADAVRLVGSEIARTFPNGTASCRYGGDEFAIALPCGAPVAGGFGENLRRSIAEIDPTLAGHALERGSVSISLGLAARRFFAGSAGSPQEEGERLFREADRALYLAKNNGRNALVAAGGS